MGAMANNHMSMTNSRVDDQTPELDVEGLRRRGRPGRANRGAKTGSAMSLPQLAGFFGSGQVAANLTGRLVGSSVPQAGPRPTRQSPWRMRALPLTSLTSAAERGPGQMLGGLPVGQMGVRVGGGPSGVRGSAAPYVMPHSPAAIREGAQTVVI